MLLDRSTALNKFNLSVDEVGSAGVDGIKYKIKIDDYFGQWFKTKSFQTVKIEASFDHEGL